MKRKGTFEEHIISSDYLKEDMKLRVYLPENFSELYKYQFCIMQDGEDYFQMGRAATLSDELHESKEIDPTIFVGIHYEDKFDRQDKYHPEGERQQNYIDFIVNEVTPFLDDTYPSHCMASCRTLIGDSLAGSLAFMIACRYPYTFSNCIMQSPFVNDTVMEDAKKASDFTPLSIYHTIGDKETEVTTTEGIVKDFLNPNRELNKYLEKKPFDYTFHEIEGGDHTWGSWQKDFKRGLLTILGK
ncbi:alpha/beta hydrolase [Salimicrobium halophilum]|uniref:Enterochelin esterase n=1 Tax=Salimicrobium halophilum TaxID=86666 RepID=A0A1G8TV56_9BACI|nr:alpha/beta hydrolase-fold protein [Salimicrobium halophilum]SDJ45456.1 Enterochelin esterase [Salimicrobium halophilum]